MINFYLTQTIDDAQRKEHFIATDMRNNCPRMPRDERCTRHQFRTANIFGIKYLGKGFNDIFLCLQKESDSATRERKRLQN